MRSFWILALLGVATSAHAGQFEAPFRDALDAAVAEIPAAGIAPEEALNAAVDPGVHYEPEFSNLEWTIPSGRLPSQTPTMASNNNVALARYEGRLFMAWRTGPLHFASNNVKMYVVSSPDWGLTWDYEATVDLHSDVREPLLTVIGGRLIFCFFQAGKDRAKFEPQYMWRMERLPGGGWTSLETWGEPKEITWDIKIRDGRAWRTSYLGDHYEGNAGISLFFSVSDNGLDWSSAPGSRGEVYHGGDSEASVEFMEDGTLWGITRNEDGDSSGFGSQLVTAAPGSPGAWEFPERSAPDRYDSPRMFRHGNDLYLLARRDMGGPFDRGMEWAPRSIRKFFLWAWYGLRPKRTTLYRIDRDTRAIVPLVDLPSDGDTAFPSILRLGPDAYLVANYTSPLIYPARSWIWGQLSPGGSQIYYTVLRFKPEN